MSLIAVITTTDSIESAQRIASSLVEQGLAACVQVSRIESFYTWRDEIQNDDEFRLLAKTTKEQYAAVETAVLKLHPYDLPAIFALEVGGAYGPYADWVAKNSTSGESGGSA